MPIKIEGFTPRRVFTALSTTALIGALSSVHVQAQEAEDEVLEELVVTGFRESLRTALDAKRNAKNIMDAIKAEDIGKSADQNIAEALQRVTGMSIGRTDGEGTSLTARGVGGDFNNVTLNGVPLTSSGDNQAVNFSEFSADILESIEVQKTPSASTDEGSLGATISLVGFKPLNAKKDRRSFEYQTRYNEFLDTDSFDLGDLGDDRKLQVTFSDKFLEDRLGVSLVASDETQGTRLDRMQIPRWFPVNPLHGMRLSSDNTDMTTPTTEQDGTYRGVVPLRVNYQYQTIQRDRTTAQLALQFRFWEGSDIQLSFTGSDQDIFRDNQYMSVLGDRNPVDAQQLILDQGTNTIIHNIDTAFDPTTTMLDFVSGPNANDPNNPNLIPTGKRYTHPGGAWRQHRDITLDVQKNRVYSFDIEQIIGDFAFDLRGGQSKTEQYDDFNLRSFWRVHDFGAANLQRTGIFAGYTCDNPRGDMMCRSVATEGLFDDGKNFMFQSFQDARRFSDDKATNIYFDVDWDKEIGIFSSFEAGMKYMDRKKVRNKHFIQCGRGCIEHALSGDTTLADFQAGTTPSDWGDQLGLPRDHLTDGWAVIDVRAARDFVEGLEAGDKIDRAFDAGNEEVLELDVKALYLQANFEALDGRIFGDFGFRYQTTEVAASGTSRMRWDHVQNFFGDNLARYGYAVDQNGVPDPNNTATQEAAQRALLAELGPLVGASGDATNGNGWTPSFPVIETHKYSDVLPSLNINFLLNDEMVLRFAASKTIARPNFNRLYPKFDTTENIFQAYSGGSIRTAKLDPFLSTNLDLSFEWYFAEGSLFSAAIFNKDFSDFATTRSFNTYYRDTRSLYFDLSQIDPNDTSSRAPSIAAGDVAAAPPTPESVLLDRTLTDAEARAAGCMPNREIDLLTPENNDFCDVANISESTNGTGGYIRGLELSIQHNFDNLPGIWSGLGFVSNYTYADSRTEEEKVYAPNGETVVQLTPEAPMVGTSEHTFNTTLYWEKNGNLIRLAYNYRTDYLQQLIVGNFGSHWNDSFDTLDLSATWKINNNLTFSFQAVNLLDTVHRRYDVRRPQPGGAVTGSALAGESLDLGSQPKGRTVRLENTGTIYRLGLRATF